jgi:hypothetical protein
MGVKGESIPRWAKIDVASRVPAAAALDRDGGDRRERARDRRQGSQLRDRLQGRNANVVPHGDLTNVGAVQDILAKNGLQDAVVQGRGAHRRRVQAVPDPGEAPDEREAGGGRR